MRLLVAEDNRSYCRVLTAILEHANYTVDAVYTGPDALEYAKTDLYDGVILDVMLPGMDGTEVVRRMRERGVSAPVMMLTAKTQVSDRIEGYNAGADDYMPKPFHSDELLARVRALVRRRPRGLTLDSGDHTLSGPLGTVRLTSKEYQIMELMLRDPERSISAEEFCKRVWGFEDAPDMSVVRVHISSLRKKTSEVSADVSIRGERGIGYSLRRSS